MPRKRHLLSLTLFSLAIAGPPMASSQPTYQEPFRPQFHYTPAQNWMNDPNGLVYYKGEHHLFYQYNPFGDTWGNMSWGHAVSRDLVHWKELPVALPADPDTDPFKDNERFFSGGAVIDKKNTSGFGTRGNPPMVAIYTSWFPNGYPPNQPCSDDQGRAGDCIPVNTHAQSIAYSLDRGRTWTKYEGNPVINGWTHPSGVPNPREFRDPKVFWYEPTQQWIMSVVLATDHKVWFYSSPNLKDWEFLSEFGPANATGGVWEVPDLFEKEILLSGKGASGKALEIKARFEAGDAEVFGLKVRVGDGEETIIGYDVAAGEVFIDRNASGIVDFHPRFTNNAKNFPSRETAPLPAENGQVEFQIFVDWSSVEVFAGQGKRLLSDQIFPNGESDGVAIFAEGGTATLKKLQI